MADTLTEPSVDVSPTADRSVVPTLAPRYGIEVLLVLGVSLGISAISAVLGLVRTEITFDGGIGGVVVDVQGGADTTYPFLDLLGDLLDVLKGTVPALLALYLLARTVAGPGFGIGLTRDRLGRDLLPGLGFAALIGLPGLALFEAARLAGVNASLNVVTVPDRWYRTPLLLLDAGQNGLLEEVVMIGFLLTRLRQAGWSDERALLLSAYVRGTYHLYQGYSAFLGNMIMGLIFGWWFQRTRRVWPLIIAHTVIDAVAFIGSIYLHGKIKGI